MRYMNIKPTTCFLALSQNDLLTCFDQTWQWEIPLSLYIYNLGLFGRWFFIFPMENPPFGESIANIFLFFGHPLSKSKIMLYYKLASKWENHRTRPGDFPAVLDCVFFLVKLKVFLSLKLIPWRLGHAVVSPTHGVSHCHTQDIHMICLILAGLKLPTRYMFHSWYGVLTVPI